MLKHWAPTFKRCKTVLVNRALLLFVVASAVLVILFSNRSWSVESNLGECSFEAVRLTLTNDKEDTQSRQNDLIRFCMRSRGFVFDPAKAPKFPAGSDYAALPKLEDMLPKNFVPKDINEADQMAGAIVKFYEARFKGTIDRATTETYLKLQNPKCWTRDWMGHWL